MKSILKTTLHHVVSIWNTSINTLTMGISIGIPVVISMFNSRRYSNIEVINADDLLYDNEPKSEPELKPEPEVEPEFETNTTLPECPICFELIDETSNRTITPCGHLFHTTCLMIHVCTNNNAHHSYGPDSSEVYNKTCPCCRAKLNDPSISGINNDMNNHNINEEFSSGPGPGPEPTVNDLFRFIQPTSYELFQVLMHMEYAHSSIIQYNNISRYSTFITRIEHARYVLTQRDNSMRDEETMNAEDDDLIMDEEDENENNNLPELISINDNDYEINSSPLQLLNPDSLNWMYD
jgi:hypothetical protein